MRLSDSLRTAIVDRVAAQWIALGCQLVGEADRTVVDPEALVAITSEVGETEPRVYEAALDWCIMHGRAVNTSRLKAVAAELDVAAERLGAFGGTIAAARGPRWPFATAGRPYRSRRKVLVDDLAAPSRLAWRIRAAFGVNARADIIAALLTMPAGSTSVAELARRTRFTKRNVALALASMRLAGVIEVARLGNEDRVRLASESPLRAWLLPRPTVAIDWTSRWKIALHSLRVVEATEQASPAVRAVEGRASVAALLPAIADAALPRPDISAVGPAFAGAYDAWVSAIGEVLRSVGE